MMTLNPMFGIVDDKSPRGKQNNFCGVRVHCGQNFTATALTCPQRKKQRDVASNWCHPRRYHKSGGVAALER